MATKTGFKQDYKGSYISKDPDAQLVYSVDWASEWLPTSTTITAVSHSITPTSATSPLTIEEQGIQDGVTFVELSGGESGEIYTVEVTVTLDDDAVESRRFRIKCEERFL
jgi:hypothetical protein